MNFKPRRRCSYRAGDFYASGGSDLRVSFCSYVSNENFQKLII